MSFQKKKDWDEFGRLQAYCKDQPLQPHGGGDVLSSLELIVVMWLVLNNHPEVVSKCEYQYNIVQVSIFIEKNQAMKQHSLARYVRWNVPKKIK
jgi:hypothetical protein